MASYNIKVLKTDGKFTVVAEESELYNFLITADTEKAAKKIALKQAEGISGILQTKLEQQKWEEEGAIRFRVQEEFRRANDVGK